MDKLVRTIEAAVGEANFDWWVVLAVGIWLHVKEINISGFTLSPDCTIVPLNRNTALLLRLTSLILAGNHLWWRDTMRRFPRWVRFVVQVLTGLFASHVIELALWYPMLHVTHEILSRLASWLEQTGDKIKSEHMKNFGNFISAESTIVGIDTALAALALVIMATCFSIVQCVYSSLTNTIHEIVKVWSPKSSSRRSC